MMLKNGSQILKILEVTAYAHVTTEYLYYNIKLKHVLLNILDTKLTDNWLLISYLATSFLLLEML